MGTVQRQYFTVVIGEDEGWPWEAWWEAGYRQKRRSLRKRENVCSMEMVLDPWIQPWKFGERFHRHSINGFGRGRGRLCGRVWGGAAETPPGHAPNTPTQAIPGHAGAPASPAPTMHSCSGRAHAYTLGPLGTWHSETLQGAAREPSLPLTHPEAGSLTQEWTPCPPGV